MKMDIKKKWPIAALSLIGLASSVSAADKNNQCANTPGAACYPDDCMNTYCLGPDNRGVNAPVRPLTCNGDVLITVAGFYWNAHQDGLDYAVQNQVVNPNLSIVTTTPPTTAALQALNVLNEGTYINPATQWDFGFKVGLAYNSACDGWDIGVMWTRFHTSTSRADDNTLDENQTLIPLWSAWANSQGSLLYATEIDSTWTLDLNLVDIELGREFWASRYLSLRPHVGLRIGFLKQDFDLDYFGGAWATMGAPPAVAAQINYNGDAEYSNNFKGVGVRAGLDSVWNLGCGWAVYGDFAAAIVYGRFSVEADENIRSAAGQHNRTDVLETSESFHTSKGALDLGLGLQWFTKLSQCKYTFLASLGWEHHLFFEQNQLWKVSRNAAPVNTTGANFDATGNNLGQNVFVKSSGDLSTQGWTLTLKFGF